MSLNTVYHRSAVKATSGGLRHDASLWVRGAAALALVGVALAGFAGFSPVRADGALEEAPGGILHRYRKNGSARLDEGARAPVRRAPRVRRTNLGGLAVEGDDIRPRRRARPSKIKRKRERKVQRNRRRVRIASLGGSFVPPRRERTRSITGGSGRVQWVASSGCLNGRLRALVYHVARNYGRVRVSSTCRSRRQNRRAGGARRSLHLSGNAVDFRVFGNVRGAAGYLRQVAGGYKHYGGGLFHVDTGPRRRW